MRVVVFSNHNNPHRSGSTIEARHPVQQEKASVKNQSDVTIYHVTGSYENHM